MILAPIAGCLSYLNGTEAKPEESSRPTITRTGSWASGNALLGNAQGITEGFSAAGNSRARSKDSPGSARLSQSDLQRRPAQHTLVGRRTQHLAMFNANAGFEGDRTKTLRIQHPGNIEPLQRSPPRRDSTTFSFPFFCGECAAPRTIRSSHNGSGAADGRGLEIAAPGGQARKIGKINVRRFALRSLLRCRV